MARSHTCTHPDGRSHICNCRHETSHSSFQNGCERYSNRPTQVDPTEESSHFVKVREIPGGEVKVEPLTQVIPEGAPPSIFIKMGTQWVEYVPKQ